jgi:hypothetical protein
MARTAQHSDPHAIFVPRERHVRIPNFGRGRRAGDYCDSMVDFSLSGSRVNVAKLPELLRKS